VLTPQGVDGQVNSNRMSVSHKESTVPSPELGGSDTGQLGPTNSTGVLNRFCPHSTLITSTTSNSTITRQTYLGDTGGPGTAIQRSNSGNYSISTEFCLPDFLGQKMGGTTTGDQPKGVKPICTSGTLQDGGFTPTTRSTSTRGLDGENGFERCLPPIPIHSSHQHLLQFIWEGKHFRFLCLPFGLSAAPWVFTKLLKPVVGFLRQIGLHLIVYWDDMLFMHANKD